LRSLKFAADLMRTADVIVAFKSKERVTEVGLRICISCRKGMKFL